jgi:hypothetical protein
MTEECNSVKRLTEIKSAGAMQEIISLVKICLGEKHSAGSIEVLSVTITLCGRWT